MLSALLLYLCFGAVAGVLAGLLGLGGGIVIVPMLNYAFAREGIDPEYIQLMAVATSMACILFTSISSVRGHHKRDSVDWPAWKAVTPGILVGTFAGTWIAVLVPRSFLTGFFICFLLYCSYQMIRPVTVTNRSAQPGRFFMALAGGGIGFVSSLVGIGGGTMSVPFLHYCGLAFRTCIGTSSAIGFPIALAGTAGYVVNGWHDPGLPVHTLGYVYVPALIGIVAASTVFATVGVRLAHRLPVLRLRRLFAVFLLVVAADMIRKML